MNNVVAFTIASLQKQPPARSRNEGSTMNRHYALNI
jgi:hypothetical protein